MAHSPSFSRRSRSALASRLIRFGGVVLLSLAMIGCSGTGESADPVTKEQTAQTKSDILIGKWNIEEIDSDPVEGDVWIQWNSDGSVTGSGGCNGFNSRWTAADATVTHTAIAATKKFCPGANAMATEQALFERLGGDLLIAEADDGIVLSGESGTIALSQ